MCEIKDLKVFAFEYGCGEADYIIAKNEEEAKEFYIKLVGTEEMERCEIQEIENWHDIEMLYEKEDENTEKCEMVRLSMLEVAKEIYSEGYDEADYLATTCD